jgi:hypothetical protein
MAMVGLAGFSKNGYMLCKYTNNLSKLKHILKSIIAVILDLSPFRGLGVIAL